MALPDPSDLVARLERVEATDQIRQLASKYAIAVDMRDIDAIVGLYVEDVKATKETSGRHALKRVFCEVLSRFRASVHHVGNHIIEFKDRDNAVGIVYTRAEHEIGDKWLPMYLHYLDDYRRIDGRWYFRRRLNCALYVVDMLERPTGPKKIRWPNREPQEGNWHATYPSWDRFWSDTGYAEKPVPVPAAHDEFIATLRAGAAKPQSQVG